MNVGPAYDEGVLACLGNLERSVNPYTLGTKEYSEWDYGWVNAQPTTETNDE